LTSLRVTHISRWSSPGASSCVIFDKMRLSCNGSRLGLLVLLAAVLFSAACAIDATVSATWSNATVLASPGLEIVLTTGDDPQLPADARILIQLDALFAVAPDAAVDDTALATTLDGSWTVTEDANAKSLAVQRSGDGSVVSSATQLQLNITGVTNPSRAGRINVGTIEISDSSASFTRTLQLPTMEIAPGAIWNAQATFSNLLSGRSASLAIRFTPAHVVPSDGMVAVYLPSMYASLSSVTLSRVAGLDGDVTMLKQKNVVWLKRDAASGTDSAEMQDVVIELDGVVHPLVEGPMGASVQLQTLDADSRIIDQTYVDTSEIFLSKARVVLSKSQLRVNEGDSTGAQYTVVLDAPPYEDTALTLSIGDVASSSTLTVEPQTVVFTTASWATPATITVTAPDDHVVTGSAAAESVEAIAHSITSGDSAGTFSTADEVSVHISENDFPAVHISDRFLAVVEGLRNDSYEISLLSKPTSDVVVDLAPRDAFIETFPRQVVFTVASWSAPKVVNVVASVAASTASATSGILHQVTSADANYNGKSDQVFPQNEVLVYFEPFDMEACMEPCRAGWFPLVNATSGNAQCVGCPLGHFCAGSCSAPVPCPKGTASNAEFAHAASVCEVCAPGTYAHVEGLSACLVCPAGASCADGETRFQPCPAGSYSSASETQCHRCPAGTFNAATFQTACEPCREGFHCPEGSVNPVACSNGTYSANAGATPCEKCPAGFECSDPTIGPVACPQGAYSPADSTTCSPCPSGHSCLSAAQEPQLCGAGFYSAEGSSSCRACPRGSHCSSSATLEPTACPQGTYSSDEGAATCRACPAGHSCVDTTQSPVLCAIGSYSLEVRHFSLLGLVVVGRLKTLAVLVTG